VQLAAGMAHDFNNLIGVLVADIHYLRESLQALPPDPERREVLDEIDGVLRHARLLVSGIQALGGGEVRLERVPLDPLVDDLLRLLRQLLPETIRIETGIAPGLFLRSQTGFLQSALLNLALNARDAMTAGGRLTLRAIPSRAPGPGVLIPAGGGAGPWVRIDIIDTGPGIPRGDVPRLFDPRFTTKARPLGHGLGLFMVRQFILRTGAALDLASRPGEGVSVSVWIAADTDPAAPADA
jgi:signal transduction histidine kinase